MPRTELPSGRYLSCPIDVSPDAGGQTRAMLMRNRLFVSEAGISPQVLSFSAHTDQAERRQTLLERGLIVEDIATPNIYEHYRDHGWGEPTGTPGEPTDVSRLRRVEETFPDGTPWRVTYRDTGRRPVLNDYLRPDGTPFLRMSTFTFREPTSWPRGLEQLGPDGALVGRFPNLGSWFRRWVRELTEGERSFVFIDSRYSAQHLVPMKAPHVHLVYMLHNVHVVKPRHWSSPTTEIYRRLLGKVDGMDALVTLTERQRDDIALRRGRTSNMFVVPNPVDMPTPVEDRPRDPNLVAVVARLEDQKKLSDAIGAFALVCQQVPEARLDIYGSGSKRDALQQQIDLLDLGHAVTLKGHDPHAREALWRASAFLMTSTFEGYPLSTLESMSHGCPVVSYDIKYGPREQITDGVDGFLVERGQKATFAARVVTLLRDPDLVARMSKAAIARASHHDQQTFVAQWQDVLEQVVALKPQRTVLDEVTAEVTDLRVVPGGGTRRLTHPRGLVAPALAQPDDRLVLAVTVRVSGHSRTSDLDSAVLSLASVHEDSGAWAELPLVVRRTESGFDVRADISANEVVQGVPVGADVRLRLRLLWGNSSWQTYLERASQLTAAVEVSFAEGGQVSIRSTAGAPALDTTP